MVRLQGHYLKLAREVQVGLLDVEDSLAIAKQLNGLQEFRRMKERLVKLNSSLKAAEDKRTAALDQVKSSPKKT